MARHFRFAELAALIQGTASKELQADFFEHHMETCDLCRDEHAMLLHLVAPRRNWADIVATAATLSRETQGRLAELKVLAKRDFDALMCMPAAVRRQKISRALSRFRNPVLVDFLLDESRRQLTRDPWTALNLAECAVDTAFRLNHPDFGQAWSMTCLARAHAHRGNALRVTGDLKHADSALALALRLFDGDGNGDPLVEAEILSFLASLKTDQGQPIEAEGYLDMARSLYEKVGEVDKLARLLVKKSVVLYDAGEFERALTVGLEAIEAVDRAADPQLYLAAEHNYTQFLQELGRSAEAWERLQTHAELYEAFPDAWTQLRRTKLAGNILRGLGRRCEAEQALIAARNGFMNEGMGFYAAVAGLDLAYLYVEEGRRTEVARLAEEMVPIFMAQDIHREVSAAMLLFQEAARREAVTATMLREIIGYVGRVRVRPASKPS